ncbi:rta1 domain [Pyrenophora seminiperda CCB06]|uniref:Rta1 domain n=1 Tax=Pyrenophora seminiperda CCB06 TaxID=1302712 RepID=A0A3M7MC19_9PLEO|nr:rta1 domain [Pyrenophora seminiperda CCB06]
MATQSSMHLGSKIIIGGLFVQLIFFGLFIIVSGVFHYRLVKDLPLQKRYGPSMMFRSKEASHAAQSSPGPSLSREHLSNLPWKRHLFNLYFASALIMIRSTFRVIEYIGGNAGYLLSHEVFLYVFDALLMFFVMLSFNLIHPSQATNMYEKRLESESTLELRQTPVVAPSVRDEESMMDDREKIGSGAWLSGWSPFKR